ncbi:MAG: hypothetical protein ACI84K_001134 [Pseudohongiellaceae bacterium]|jgi:hypothetical protein
MKKISNCPVISALSIAISSIAGANIASASVDEITTALTSGKAYGDFRLRYEGVDQDNALDDAHASTLRTRLGYTTGTYEGFSSTIEFEDSRVVAGQDEYDIPGFARPAGYVAKGASVVADQETTELDQAFLQYNNEILTAKAGRQVLTYDNHRYVGHVGWRQDRQTFDAVSFNYSPLEDLELNYAYLDQRNRIFGEEADIDAKDHLLNVGYKTSLGKLSTYAYLLEDTVTNKEYDTYGIRFNGATEIKGVKALYTAEYAYQEHEIGGNTLESNYMLLEGGAVVSGITAKVGYEILGSDDGTYGFSTPLATLHKFNGWTDQFLNTPNQGLKDLSLSVSGKLAGGKVVVAYHDFSADDSSSTADDLGSEIDILYAKKFGENYSAGIKYGAYSAGDSTSGKVDTDKVWFWLGAKF